MKKILDFYRNTNQYVNDAFERVIVNIYLKKQDKGYKTFLLSGCEPGVGTTTLAINIAISMAVSGWKTVLMDGDMRKGIQYKRLNTAVEKGLTEYLNGEAVYEQILYETNFKELNYIPGGNGSPNSVSLLCSNKMDELMSQLMKEYDYIILDMPSVTTSIDANILVKKVDATVLVAAYSVTNKKSIREAKDMFNKSGANMIGIILNKVESAEYKHIMRNLDYFNKRRYLKNVKKVGKHNVIGGV